MDALNQPMPASTGGESNKRLFLITGIIALALLVLGAAVFFVTRSRPTATQEEMMYFLNSVDGGNVLAHTGIDTELKGPDVGIDGTVVEYVEREDLSLAIVRQGNAPASSDLYLITDSGRALTDDGHPKYGLVVSADGSKAAYARFDGEVRPWLPLASNFSDWTIVVLDLLTGAETVVGSGYGPQFAALEGLNALVYVAAEGHIASYNLDTEMRGINTSITVPGTFTMLHVSPDGSHAALFNPVTQYQSLFEIQALFPEPVLNPVGETKTHFMDVVLSNDAMYGLTLPGTTQEIRRIPFDDLHAEGSVLTRLPEAIEIDRLIPQR